jgi:hypothetical protein
VNNLMDTKFRRNIDGNCDPFLDATDVALERDPGGDLMVSDIGQVSDSRLFVKCGFH